VAELEQRADESTRGTITCSKAILAKNIQGAQVPWHLRRELANLVGLKGEGRPGVGPANGVDRIELSEGRVSQAQRDRKIPKVFHPFNPRR